MMGTKIYPTVRCAVMRILKVIIVTAIVGILAGVMTLYAEERTGLPVSGVGNVATAATYGWTYQDTLYAYAYGRSTSSVSLYEIVAHVRIWHQSTGGNLLQRQDRRVWRDSMGGYTGTIVSTGYGDRAVTLSSFRPAWTSGNVYYTSWPDYSASCYKYWNSGNNC